MHAYGDKTNAGITDLESSVYLSVINTFITADKPQQQAFEHINHFNDPSAQILSWHDLHHAFLGINRKIRSTMPRVEPITYDVVLNRAHARTFNLQRKLQIIAETLPPDAEVAEVLQGDNQSELFVPTGTPEPN